jgi:FkbM family methyltransferase
MLKSVVLCVLLSVHSRWLYLLLTNLISRLLGTSIQARAADGTCVTVNGYHLPHFKRLTFYIYGLEARAKGLAKDYVLDYVPIDPGDLVIDCGANTGDLRLVLQDKRIEGLRYIGFEPSGPEFQCLVKNTSFAENVACDLRQVALSNKTGEVEFYQSIAAADGSLVEPATYEAVVSVKTDLLDNQLSSEGPIKLIKLEAEGFEPEILQGARQTLARTAYLVADVGFERGIREESTLPQVVNLMQHHGFEVIGNSKQRLTLLFRNTVLQTN